jgi:asparagine synthase (glutamine-hydrolysing)
MCRIFGTFGNQPVDEISLQRAAASMKHGGPDRQSYHAEDAWAVGTDRLAIQGVAGGDQPFMQHDGLCAALNGEIYNHRELRGRLREEGFVFQDNCDGNVIAPLFLLYGPDFVKYLDGMFAIAVIDTRQTPSLHLYSDPTAVKSLYYRWNDKTKSLSFASEIEALALITQEPLIAESKGTFDYLSLRAVCGEQTIFKNIKTLEPSRYLRYELNREPTLTTYQSLITAQPPEPILEKAGKQLQNLLDDEVNQMMHSDVPACVVTSGGLDSTLISALASRHNDNLHSFHICYKGNWPLDERLYAKEAADQFGTIHHEIEIDLDTFPDLIQRMTAHIGQPNTAPHSLSTYSLFQGIHDAGFRVALTGEGSDEMFAGYERFNAALSPGDDWITGYMDKFGPFPAAIRNAVLTPEFQKTSHSGPTKIEEFTNQILQTKAGAERLDALQAIDQWERFPYYILRRVDHLSMAHAVEVRVPFCQPRIADFSRQLPLDYRISDGQNKRIVYEAARGLLPQSVLTRKKQGFTLPVTAMFVPGNRLFDFMVDVVDSYKARERGIFQPEKMRSFINQQATTPSDGVANMLWSAMSLELWHQHVDKLNLNLAPRSQSQFRPNNQLRDGYRHS